MSDFLGYLLYLLSRLIVWLAGVEYHGAKTPEDGYRIAAVGCGVLLVIPAAIVTFLAWLWGAV